MILLITNLGIIKEYEHDLLYVAKHESRSAADRVRAQLYTNVSDKVFEYEY